MNLKFPLWVTINAWIMIANEQGSSIAERSKVAIMVKANDNEKGQERAVVALTFIKEINCID